MRELPYNISKLIGGNYHQWRFAIINVLEMSKLDKYIRDDYEPKPEEADEARKAKNLLVLNIDASLYNYIEGCSSAVQIWIKLKTLYDEKGLNRKIGLLRSLISVRLEACTSMQAYVDEIMSTANRLKGIGFGLNDDWLAAVLLAGLTEEYKPLLLGLEASNKVVTSELVVGHLLDNSNGEASQALLAKGKNGKKKKAFKCFNCGKPGHFANKCKAPKKEDKKAGAFISTLGMAASYNSQTWFLDSGASRHMCPTKEMLEDVNLVKGGMVHTACGTVAVEGVGASSLTLDRRQIGVQDILYVPNLKVNLLSISQMAKKGNRIVFDKNGCTVFDELGQRLASVNDEGGVYKIRSDTCYAAQEVPEQSALMWHRRLGHMNAQTMIKMKKAVSGLNFSDLAGVKDCKTCSEAKQHVLPFQSSSSSTTRILELLHTDLMGPMETESIGRARYILTFVDDYSKYVWAYFLREKSEVAKRTIEHIKHVERQTEKQVKILRSDNGREYVNATLTEFCRANGIVMQTSVPYTPQQNGTAERMNRTIVEKAKCLLFDADLPKSCWAEATHMATYLINRSLSASHGKIPMEVYSGSTVDITHLKLFGSSVMVHKPKQRRQKWDKNSSKMIFVGYDDTTKGYRCLDLRTRQVIVSRNVVFHEQLENHGYLETVRAAAPPKEATMETPDEQPVEDETKESIEDASAPNESLEDSIAQNQTVEDPTDPDYSPEDSLEEDAGTPPRRMTRATSNLFPFWHSNLAHIADIDFAMTCVENDDPVTIDDLKHREDAGKWQKAMRDEIDSLHANKTWDLVERPKNCRTIQTKWVFKTKRNQNGDIVRHKARLVARGFTQRYGIDYAETYSPVVRYTTVRLLVAWAATHKMKIHQMDVVTAYLQGDVEEELYLEQPQGFSDDTDKVCRLRKAIYGLKQAGRAWNKKLDAELKDMNLRQSAMDSCIYFNSDYSIIIAIYVDDFLIIYNDDRKLDALKEMLSNVFNMKDMGEAKGCIGIRIKQKADRIELDQTTYIIEVLKRFGMIDCKPIGNPGDTNVKLVKDDANSIIGQVPFQEAIGCLSFIAQGTRPDIAYSVNDVSRFNHCYTAMHWKAVKRIMRYLKGTISLSLVYSQGTKSTQKLMGYTDADWGSDSDTRKSVTGYVFGFCGGIISWKSAKQRTVALSSTEAEYMALSETMQEGLWLKQLLEELAMENEKTATVIRCDNQSAIKLALLGGYRPRTRHIDIRWHFIREYISKDHFKVEFVTTDKNVADVFTKSVGAAKLLYAIGAMNLKNVS